MYPPGIWGNEVAIGIPPTGSYPIGNAPVPQPESLKSSSRQRVVGVDASFVPLTYLHVEPLFRTVTTCGLPLLVPDARQLPPKSLSRPGLTSSIELPGGSPTVGHGNPRP